MINWLIGKKNCELKFFSKSQIGITACLVVEATTLTLGILAITNIFPKIGNRRGIILSGLGGCSLVITLALLCFRTAATEEKFTKKVTNRPYNPPYQKKKTFNTLEVETPQTKLKKPQQLPTALYTCDSSGVSSLKYWNSSSPEMLETTKCTIEHSYPVAASPEHGKSFALPGDTPQYIVFNDGIAPIFMNFKLPLGAKFMKPNVDTMLMCFGIHRLFQENVQFKKAIDIGTGSGFIAKYIAVNKPALEIAAIDIDPLAGSYMRTPESGMPANVQIVIGDAITKLSQEGHLYDLIVSNPPYVPTVAETQSKEKITVNNPNFWSGTTLISHMLEETLITLNDSAHLLIVVPSTALKSQRLYQFFQTNTNFQARILHQQEVAYKAWFAGNNQVNHLLATNEEATKKTKFVAANLDLFVGITKPGFPRTCLVEDGRRAYKNYYWQMIYIIDFVRK